MPKIRGVIPIADIVIRTKPLAKPLKKPVPKRKRPPPSINLVQNVPPTNRRLVGDTIFHADPWHGLLGRSEEWYPAAAIENALRERGRR